MREERLKRFYKTTDGGITPACAGRTASNAITAYMSRDHPRVCGKNPVLRLVGNLVPGSPPRVREERSYEQDTNGPLRITPACAGRTNNPSPRSCAMEDHPRVCGKNSRCLSIMLTFPGSPPRVREERLHRFGDLDSEGITPACAGRTHYLA